MGLAELADALNRIRQTFPSVPVLCIPWIHLKHPLHPVQQEFLGLQSSGNTLADVEQQQGWIWRLARKISASDSWLLRALLCITNGVRLSIKVGFLKLEFRDPIKTLQLARFDMVAKTWCFGPARRSNETDFYYGDLPERLARASIRLLLLCGDANDTSWRPFAKTHFSTQQPFKLPEWCLVPIAAPLMTACAQVGASLKLRRYALSADEQKIRKIAMRASLDVLLPAVTQPSLLFQIAKESVKRWNPAAFITLYEGHGWEKAAWWGAKLQNPECRTVGYQHTLLFPEALTMLQPFVDQPERSVPDIVLALGSYTARLIDAGHRAHGVCTLPFGSFRHDAPDTISPANPALRTVLVVPEGIMSEMQLMFRFAADCARLMPSHQFIFRIHPKWQQVRALEDVLHPALAQQNISLSNYSLDDDCKRSSVMMYRGSSTILYGVLSGLLPVYLTTDGTVDSDPISHLSVWRNVCETPDDFKRKALQFEAESAEERETEWRLAVTHLKNYIHPVSDASISDFIRIIDTKRGAQPCIA